jgi:hypothetical protein
VECIAKSQTAGGERPAAASPEAVDRGPRQRHTAATSANTCCIVHVKRSRLQHSEVVVSAYCIVYMPFV